MFPWRFHLYIFITAALLGKKGRRYCPDLLHTSEGLHPSSLYLYGCFFPPSGSQLVPFSSAWSVMLDTLILEDATAGQPGGFDVSVTIRLLQLPLKREGRWSGEPQGSLVAQWERISQQPPPDTPHEMRSAGSLGLEVSHFLYLKIPIVDFWQLHSGFIPRGSAQTSEFAKR